MTSSYLFALFLTLTCEVPLATLLAGDARTRGRVALTAALLNLFTHPLAVLGHRRWAAPDDPFGWAFVLLEAAVVTAEAVGYRRVAQLGWGRAWGVSGAANGVTIALSLLLAR